MTDRVELIVRPKPDAKALDAETAERIRGVAHADSVELGDDGAIFAFSSPAGDRAMVRGNLELAARFELGAHWHTRYELVSR